jgi:DNA-binding transcriptional ArsR family regulator
VTSHGLVLVYVAMHADATIREISREVGLTERRVMEILRDLKDADLLGIERQGRRNVYTLRPDAGFMHPHLANVPVSEFLKLVEEQGRKAS